MGPLDSRCLHTGDLFGQTFPEAALVRYRLLACDCPETSPEFTINVGPRGATANESTIHQVMVAERDGTLVADPPFLSVQAGDMVMWSAAESYTGTFTVESSSTPRCLSSQRLGHGALYGHAFRAPGMYAWIDALGSGLRGEVRVNEPASDGAESDVEAWLSSLRHSSVIRVSDESSEPLRVNVPVDSMVFWVIQDRRGVTITDPRCCVTPTVAGVTRKSCASGP